jgi:(1->4)-alpha-D-glucan 1-alpha-D-glucosylmutase
MMPPSIPAATYRLQFNSAFTFDDATEIVDYLDRLGVSHCYASSYFKAVPGSTHGYDVADPGRLNPEIGDRASYNRWIETLRAHAMGHVVDWVPNHMGIAKSANPWWQDVLENGPSSQYASFFDIDWHPLKPELENRVLLPILGDSYGAVLERQQITLEYVGGAFSARYFDVVLPIAPGTYDRILGIDVEHLLADIEGTDAETEFLSILTAIGYLPGRAAQRPEQRQERNREKEVIKRRLARLTEESPAVLAHIKRAVTTLNGDPKDPRTFDRLDELLSSQPYRLAYWRVAAEEINYRRFFDINELAALRMEDPPSSSGRTRSPWSCCAKDASTVCASTTSTVCTIRAITSNGCRRGRGMCDPTCSPMTTACTSSSRRFSDSTNGCPPGRLRGRRATNSWAA